MNKIVILLLTISLNSNALDRFKAEYTVYKDGKQIGTSSIELSEHDGVYTITDSTNGTHGMASFLGFKRSETTVFTENTGEFIPNSYDLSQKVAFKKNHSSYQIDNETQIVSGTYKGKEWQQTTPDTFYTPNLVSLRLFQDICSKKTNSLSYQVLKKGKLKKYNFKITSTKDNIIEVDKIHANPNTTTKTWIDTNQLCLPIKTYHKEKDEDVLETKLINVIIN